jgi:hypothetical protein
VVDPSTGLTVLGAAIGTKDLVVKVLGPTAEYVGDGLKNWTERRVANLGRVFSAAARKLPELPPSGESVPPRVLGAVMNDASFAEDPVTAEYFGGVLASSRSGVRRDDRGTVFVSLIARLSTYQVRAHYVFYSVVRSVHLGSSHSVLMRAGRAALRVCIPFRVFASAMGLEQGEDANSIISHAIFGLKKEGLIDDEFVFGPRDYIQRLASAARNGGLVVGPSALGADLFLWANGLPRVPSGDFLSSAISIKPLAEVEIRPGSFAASNAPGGDPNGLVDSTEAKPPPA